jgi:copper(I)-binding protein
MTKYILPKVMTLALILQALPLVAQSQSTDARVTNAWAGLAPPTMAMNAGYFSLSNHSDKGIVLVSADSPAYESIEIHQSQLEDGIASMRMLKSLAIESHGQVQFESGGLHLMMRKPVSNMSLGDRFAVQLHFDDGSAVDFEMQVLKSMPQVNKSEPSGAHQEHHHHHAM